MNKSHWLFEVSHAYIIGRELFPKHHFLVFLTFDQLTLFDFEKILTEKVSQTFQI